MKYKKDLRIYVITNLKNKMQYVGQAKGHTIEKRLGRHFTAARSGKGYDLHNAIRIHGEENFIAEQICSCLDIEELNNQEKHFIKTLNTLFPLGYNKTKGGAPYTEKFGNEIQFKGKKYLSHSSLARDYNIDPFNLRQRITKYGWTVSQALELERPPDKKPTRSKQFKFNNETFDSFREACKHFKLNEDNVRGRLERGWTKSQAFNFEKPPKRKPINKKSLLVDDQYFESIAEACEFFKVRRDKYIDRKNRGWTIEQIFGVHAKPPRKHPNDKVFKVGTKVFNSIESANKYYGLYQHAINNRLKLGWTPEEACGLVKRKRIENYYNAKPITVEEIKYPSISKAAKEYGFRHQRILRRLNSGWSINQAFGLEPHPLMRLKLRKSRQKKT